MNPRIQHLKRHCTPQLYQLGVWKLKYTLHFVVSYFQPLHGISNQELFKKHLYNPRIPKERNCATCPNHINYCLKSEIFIALRCRLCSTRYTAVRIKNCLKSTSAIKIGTMKNTDDFHFKGKQSCARAKSTPFPVSKDEWDTKEDTGKSMKNALYVPLWYTKRHLSGRSNVKQWKNQACGLSRYRVTLVWRHQSVTYSVSQ